MKLAVIGLGRMGKNMAKRLLNDKHDVLVYNRTFEKAKELENYGAKAFNSLEKTVKNLKSPRIIWLMLPSGDITDKYLGELYNLLDPNDIIIDGGNSYYKEDIKRESKFKEKNIFYLDAGVSGGIWGLEIGYCTMVGGNKEKFKFIEPIIKTLAPKDGYLYCGKSGSGHFIKMIHNGIEYAMMQAYGEGFEIIKASNYSDINLEEVSKMWNSGSVIRSWLLELLGDAFKKDTNLERIKGYVEDSGEARWTVKEAIDNGVAADVITTSLYKRFNSRQDEVFANKVTAALRNEFGGHYVLNSSDKDKRKENIGAGKIKAAKADKIRS